MAAASRRLAVFLAALTLLTLAAVLACGEPELMPAAPPTLAPAVPGLTPPFPPPNLATDAPPPTPPSVTHSRPLPPAATPAANAGPRPRWVGPPPTMPPSLSPGPPPAGYTELPNAAALTRQNPAAAQALQALPWVVDGIVADERAAAAALVNLAIVSEPLLGDLLAKAWVNRVANFPELETALTALQGIAARMEPAAARRLAAMPFLNSLEPADAAALESLAQLAAADRQTFEQVIDHPALAGGIDDDAAKVVSVLAGVQRTNPALLPRLLNLEQVAVEERIVDRPGSGPLTLAIIRLDPDAAGHPGSMDLLAAAVRFIADYMGEPFPVRYVALLFAEAVPDYSAGANFGTHIAVRPQYDSPAADYPARNRGRAMAHEVAHYYWAGNAPWLDEGAAELLAALFAASHWGGNPRPNHYPCASVSGIRDLAAADYALDAAGGQCPYALGERLFLDLRRALGAADFRIGFRRLYRELAAEGGGNKTGIAAVRRAFAGEDFAAGPAAQDRAQQVINRWHNGAELSAWPLPDPRAAVADLPAINGRIRRVYLSLTPGGPPSHRFIASAAGDWAWLNLEYSYHFSGPPQELELEVVEYFADGFAYREVRDAVTLTAPGGGGWRRYSVGPGPGRQWAAGRHGVLVYHQGVKVAAVEYEVTE